MSKFLHASKKYGAVLLTLTLFQTTFASRGSLKNTCTLLFEASTYTGVFSTPAQLRAQEKSYQPTALKDFGAQVKPGDLDTVRLREDFQKNGKINYEWGTPTDPNAYTASLLINRAQIEQSKQNGQHYSEVYNAQTVIDFLEMKRLLNRYPNDKFELNIDIWKEAHRLGGKSAMPGAQKAARFLEPFFKSKDSKLYNLLYMGGGNYRHARSRLYDDNLTMAQIEGIMSVRDSLIELGFFPEAKGKKLKAYSILRTHWSTGHKNPSKNGNGTYDVVMSYPSPKIVPEAMDSIFKWANDEMYKFDNQRPGARDPVEIAALIQIAMVYIHAGKDGNGRVTKGFKNKLLEKYGLAPDLRYGTQAWHDLDLGVEAFVAGVREGIYYANNQFSQIKSTKPPSAIDAKLGLEVGKHNLSGVEKSEKKIISTSAIPKNVGQIFTVGKDVELELIFRGNFYQGKHGVLYQYVPKENALYPITDWSATLYGQGGELYIKDTGKNRYNFRRPNRTFNKHINYNLTLFKGLINNTIDATSITIKPYRDLTQYHQGFGKIKLYDFQRELVASALESNIDPVKYPLAVLSPARGNQISPKRSGPTNLQLQFSTNKTSEIHFGPIMAAYQIRRSFLIKLEQDILELDPSLHSENKALFDKAHEDAYLAAKTILKPFSGFFNEVFNTEAGQSNHPALINDKGYHEWAKNHDALKAFNVYKENQEWAYETYAEAIRKVDQEHTFVIRNIAKGNLKWLGLISEVEQARFFKKWIPGLEDMAKKIDGEIKRSNKAKERLNVKNIDGIITKAVAKFVSEYDGEGNRKEADKKVLRRDLRASIDKAVKGTFANHYSARGMEIEFARPFMNLYLHTVGFHPQGMKSTTVDPFYNWVLNGQNKLKFYTGGASILYKLKVNDEAVDAKFSPYTAQNEVVDRTELYPRALKRRTLFKTTEARLKLREQDGSEYGVFQKSRLSRAGTRILNVFKSQESIDKDLAEQAARQAAYAEKMNQYGQKTEAILSGMVYKPKAPVVPETTPVYNSRNELLND